jgi:hypothetical protein
MGSNVGLACFLDYADETPTFIFTNWAGFHDLDTVAHFAFTIFIVHVENCLTLHFFFYKGGA